MSTNVSQTFCLSVCGILALPLLSTKVWKQVLICCHCKQQWIYSLVSVAAQNIFIYSQHFCNGMILSWPSLIKQFSFSRKKQSTANQQRLDLFMCCYSAMTVSWDSINHAVKCLCRSQFFGVKLSYITCLRWHLNQQLCCLKLTFRRG